MEKDPGFQKEMFDAMNNLERYPALKNKVWQQLNDFHLQLEQDKGHKGMLAGEMARQRLIQKQKDEEEAYNLNIDNMVLQTSKTSALNAINLNQLLKKKWQEEKNAY